MDYKKRWNVDATELLYKDNLAEEIFEARADKIDFKLISDVVKDYKNILDIGCGTGIVYWYLKKHNKLNNKNYTMIDLKIGNNKVCKKINNILPDLWDGIKLPYKDNQFDLGISLSVMHHIEPKDISAFFKENIRVCKNFYLITCIGDGEIKEYVKKGKKGICAWHNYHKIIKDNNLKIISDNKGYKMRTNFLLNKKDK